MEKERHAVGYRASIGLLPELIKLSDQAATPQEHDPLSFDSVINCRIMPLLYWHIDGWPIPDPRIVASGNSWFTIEWVSENKTFLTTITVAIDNPRSIKYLELGRAQHNEVFVFTKADVENGELAAKKAQLQQADQKEQLLVR